MLFMKAALLDFSPLPFSHSLIRNPDPWHLSKERRREKGTQMRGRGMRMDECPKLLCRRSPPGGGMTGNCHFLLYIP